MSATCKLTLVNNERTLAKVTFNNAHRILTTVTHSDVIVTEWINETVQGFSGSGGGGGGGGGGGDPRQYQLVGLEVACQPNGNIVLLQLCVGNRCLIYQLLHCGDANPPREFYEFLDDARFCFVGVGVEVVAYGLKREHGFLVRNKVDLGDTAAVRLGRDYLRGAGLEKLASEVMRVEMERPAEVWRSAWWGRDLSPEQIAYACADAFVSYDLGRILLY